MKQLLILVLFVCQFVSPYAITTYALAPRLICGPAWDPALYYNEELEQEFKDACRQAEKGHKDVRALFEFARQIQASGRPFVIKLPYHGRFTNSLLRTHLKPLDQDGNRLDRVDKTGTYFVEVKFDVSPDKKQIRLRFCVPRGQELLVKYRKKGPSGEPHCTLEFAKNSPNRALWPLDGPLLITKEGAVALRDKVSQFSELNTMIREGGIKRVFVYLDHVVFRSKAWIGSETWGNELRAKYKDKKGRGKMGWLPTAKKHDQRMAEHGFYELCDPGFNDWVEEMKVLNVQIVYVTARSEHRRDCTRQILRSLGVSLRRWIDMPTIMGKTAYSKKSRLIQEYEEKYGTRRSMYIASSQNHIDRINAHRNKKRLTPIHGVLFTNREKQRGTALEYYIEAQKTQWQQDEAEWLLNALEVMLETPASTDLGLLAGIQHQMQQLQASEEVDWQAVVDQMQKACEEIEAYHRTHIEVPGLGFIHISA